MTTPAFEAFLARLYTDEEFLGRFLADSRGEALRAGLSEPEADALAQVDCVGLKMAADGFRRKRAGKD